MTSEYARQLRRFKRKSSQPHRLETETNLPANLRSDAHTISQLQGIIGNAAVQRWLTDTQIQRDPEIHAGNGTTEELRNELTRLRTEMQSAPANEQAQYQVLINKLVSRIAERGDSTLPDSAIQLVFDGRTLTASGSVSFSYPAVSGTPDARGQFDYSPERQRMENVGPIPEGTYWLDASQVANLWHYFGQAASAWGSHRLTIHPFDSTHTFGRGGFFIHGGAVPGSIGCIDLTSNIGKFVQEVLQHPDAIGTKIMLRVQYPLVGDFPTPSETERHA
jgi:hypothetical protein